MGSLSSLFNGKWLPFSPLQKQRQPKFESSLVTAKLSFATGLLQREVQIREIQLDILAPCLSGVWYPSGYLLYPHQQPHSKYQWWHPWHLSWNFKKATVYPLPSLQEHSPEWMLWNHTGFCCPLNTPQALVSAPTQPRVSTPSRGPQCTAGVPRERIYKLLLSYEISSSQSLGAQ